MDDAREDRSTTSSVGAPSPSKSFLPSAPRTPRRASRPTAGDAASQRSSSPSAMSTRSATSDCVKVIAVVRPLIARELALGSSEALVIAEDSVATKSGHQFTYDGVSRGNEDELAVTYDAHVKEIVGGVLQGYNGSVMAYGQTGSGKTHTMGMGGDNAGAGMARRVFDTIFASIADCEAMTTVKVCTSFIEIYKDEIRDLLLDSEDPEATATATAVTIRENPKEGGVYLNGARIVQVSDVQGCLDVLEEGILRRATAESTMNVRSSRSHAILTINVETKVGDAKATLAKLHLVDLAGSERVTLNESRGQRFKEGVQINMGLLALSNCISALTDANRREWGHVPYRDSKLTRLLQDSLGGNSRTVMFACVSPADTNADETLNTLKYANRARSIRNRVAVNFEKSTKAELKLKRQLDAATERIAQLEMLVNVLHGENEALKQATPESHAFSQLAMTPDIGSTPRTPMHTPVLGNTPMSELLESCRKARQRAVILLSTNSPAKSPLTTPRGSIDLGGW